MRRHARAGTARSASPARGAADRDRGIGRREPRPRDLSGEAEHVEHRRFVVVDSRPKDRAFPRGGGGLEAVEHRHDLAQPVQAVSRSAGSTCCHLNRKRMKSAGTDRLDLGAQPVDGIPVNAGEERAIAPFDCDARGARRAARSRGRAARSAIRRESTPQDDALGFERQERGVGILDVDCQRVGERLRGRRAREGQAAAEDLGDGDSARPVAAARRWRLDRRIQHRAGMDGEQFRQALRGDEQSPLTRPDGRSPA